MSEIISGKEIASKIKSKIAEEVGRIEIWPPKLAVIQVGDDLASSTYVKNKERACAECGIACENIHLPDDVKQEDLLEYVKTLNEDDVVDGILVQLPLPPHIDASAVIETIDPRKDVDGFTAINAGNLFLGKPSLVPCTAAGIVELLRFTGVSLSSKNAVVIGRSNIVGKPMALLLQQENMNVTMLHSKTSQEDMEFYCRHADVIVVATGHENTLTDRHFYGGKNPIIIDVGINRGADGKLHGDVSEAVKAKWSSYYTPCIGGVGPMTVAMLMKNVLTAYKIRQTINNCPATDTGAVQKTGAWILKRRYLTAFWCSQCDCVSSENTPYCPFCGSRFEEMQEKGEQTEIQLGGRKDGTMD